MILLKLNRKLNYLKLQTKIIINGCLIGSCTEDISSGALSEMGVYDYGLNYSKRGNLAFNISVSIYILPIYIYYVKRTTFNEKSMPCNVHDNRFNATTW